MKIVHLNLGDRVYAATKTELNGRAAWLFAGERSAQFVGLCDEATKRVTLWDLALAHRVHYGAEICESSGTLVVHRHPGNHRTASVAIGIAS